MPIQVVKADGQKQEFSEAKVRHSLKRAGANPATIEKVVTDITGKIYEGITTREIYRLVFARLRELEADVSGRYGLKQWLMGLGPTGHPFEQLVGKLFAAMGYRVQTQVMVKGACIAHEVDVVAEKAGEHILVECKYHNQPGGRCHSKTALYVQARFEDIMDYHLKHPELGTTFHQIWLVTNTKLTSSAIEYGRCKGMGLLAWRYPEKDGLEQLIEKFKLYPS
ncbi:MAG TPA: ATP cone domain-containing protein [Patescibacteria group bacterium]|nr:ATP cone domain-containing protein [Patescibacteria group bacterium]